MKTFVIKVFVFTFIILVLNVFYLLLVGTLDWNFSKRIEAITFENPSYEYIVLGNSLAMDGIDTELLSSGENEAYNLSMGGTSLRANHIQLQEYLEIASAKPKIVILGLGSYLNDFQSETLNTIIGFTMDDYTYSLDDLPMIKFRWLRTELLKKVISSDHRNAKIIQGQLRIGRVVADHTEYVYPHPKFALSDYQASSNLKKIAALCREKGIKLIVVEMPGFKNTQNNSSVGPYKLLVEGNFYVDLYNLNNYEFNSYIDPETDWLGDSHFNMVGAKKFTRKLKAVLELDKISS
ncbi:MAG: hypothetical protein WD491_00675 [Balneolales bacterium]